VNDLCNNSLFVLFTEEYENVCIPVCIDGLCLIRRDSSLCALYDVLVEVMKRQLVASEACVLSELSSTSKISPPQPLHFSSDLSGHFITLFYPKDVSDSDLGKHKIFVIKYIELKPALGVTFSKYY
jgi:hypothetical protein